MRFQHPELLYALLLLLIPLIVHLFRLRKFQKEDFTNVKFLKKVIQETRKSSRLKKFLILTTRLLLVACLVLAFAQPYIPSSEKALRQVSKMIYLDNSFSLQARNSETTALDKALNQLLENLDEQGNLSLFTNNSEFRDRKNTGLKTEIQAISFTQENLDFRAILLKAESYFNKYPTAEKELVLISDFQTNLKLPSDIEQEGINLHFVKNRTEELNNISLDTAFVMNSSPENLELGIRLSNAGDNSQSLSVSVKDGDRLLGRSSLDLAANQTESISFRLKNEPTANGIIEIEDNGLTYDNRLYFNIAEKPAVQTLIISEGNEEFLQRIYTEPEFEVSVFKPRQIDFNKLNAANLVILNEVELISPSLLNNLGNLQQQGASIVIIPPQDAVGYSPVLNRLGLPGLTKKVNSERLITKIEFDHPFLSGVFEDRTDNFEYPRAATSYEVTSSEAILNYADNRPFLIKNEKNYLFSAALNPDNSNFQNSPLIVPILYQIGLQALRSNKLYYQTTTNNKIDIPANLGNDEVVHLVADGVDLIPQQQNFSNRVEISTERLPLQAGNYSVVTGGETIARLSFNYDRSESELEFIDLSDYANIKQYDSVTEYLSESKAAGEITSLWKWFVIFALILLGIEMLLIKFLK